MESSRCILHFIRFIMFNANYIVLITMKYDYFVVFLSTDFVASYMTTYLHYFHSAYNIMKLF